MVVDNNSTQYRDRANYNLHRLIHSKNRNRRQYNNQQLVQAIPSLKVRPDFSTDGICYGGRINGYEAPGVEGNVAWMSSVYLPDKVSSLTIFNGPLTNVPHLVSRCCIRGDDAQNIYFTLDFSPRAYGAYEKRDAEGNYPGPEELGRVAFEYSGNRMEYESNFGTPQVVDFIQSTLSNLVGATPNNRPLSDDDLLIRGPLLIDVIVPATESNIVTMVAARATAANYWLQWAISDAHNHRPGAPINSQYVYDTKFKLRAYGALLRFYSTIFPESDALQIASGESGPLDEAYVGGAS